MFVTMLYARDMPASLKQQPSVTRTFRFSPDLDERLAQLATDERRSLNQEVIQLLEEALAARNAPSQ